MQKHLLFFLSFSSLLLGYNTHPDERDTSEGGFYINAFTGWGLSTCSNYLEGKAFYQEELGGNLYVNAYGGSQNSYLWYGGVTLGYDFTDIETTKRYITHALEIEGYYFANSFVSTCFNKSFRLEIHKFEVTLPSRTGILLANALFQYSNKILTPYVGIGVGADMVYIDNGFSEQLIPEEPGINHFNSNPNDFQWSFAAQTKLGIFHTFTTNYLMNVRIFLEYRFLYQAPSIFTFGSTDYPTHVETSDWQVTVSNRYTNMFGGGIGFIF